MNLYKFIIGAVLILSCCNPIASQDFQSVINDCVDKIINTSNLALKIDVSAIDSKNQKVLQRSSFNLYKDEKVLYSEGMGRKTYFDLGRNLVFGVDHNSRLATISKLEGDIGSIKASLSSMLGVNSELEDSFKVKTSEKEGLMTFSVFYNESLIREFVIDVESNEFTEATLYQTKAFDIDGNQTLPLLKFKYDYSIDDLDISPFQYFTYADNIWKLKNQIDQYKLVDTTNF